MKGYETKYADGGDIAEFSDNQLMIMNQNVEVEHHHEELEDILEDKIPVPAWVVAKMETATQNLSDITHYLDGQKEIMEDQLEEDDDDDDDDEMEMEEIENKEVVEPIVVTAGDKTEITKNFTDDAWDNLRGFLKGFEGIELRDDYTFDYKDEQFEVEPIINSDENGVSNAVFTIFDGDGEEVGEIDYSREGGKQKFTANSEFFSWNGTKFEDGGFMNGVYADGGEIKGEIKNAMEWWGSLSINQQKEFAKNYNNSYYYRYIFDYGIAKNVSKNLYYKIIQEIWENKGKPKAQENKKFADGGFMADAYANGGSFEKVRWQDVEIGDSARVKELNRMGLIVHSYGRKFNLKFPNGTEKTFDASDLEFYKLEKDEYELDDDNNYAKGGSVKKDWWQTVVNPNEDFHNYDNRKPIDWEVDDFKEWVVSNSDLDGNVDKEVLDVIKMPKSKLTVEYLNKNGSGKNNNEYYKEFGNWQSALYDIFTQMKKDYLFKKSRKYILKADIKTVTVKRKGKEVTYNGSDVLNGAYVLAKGGDMTSKANYVGKNDVVEVELKDGSKVKPANGYWIKKGAEPIGAEPTPTASGKSETKFGETYIKKDMRNNWKAETTVDDFNDYDWRISTIKTYSGKLISSAQGGKTEPTGSKGIQMWKYTMYQDPNYTLEVSTPKRLTEKLVAEQHEKALAKFKKFMETGMFKGGGKISNFDKLSAKVAKEYEGKAVKSQYQEEYGKYYSKEEAQEVGDKVAGKVKAMQADNKAFGGLFSSAKKMIPTKTKYPELDGKQVRLKSGELVQVFYQDKDELSVLDVGKLATGQRPHMIKIDQVDLTSFKMGGSLRGSKSVLNSELFKEANVLAKKIRKDGESWNDAKKRAFAQLKK